MTSRINVQKMKTETFQMTEISKFKFVIGQKKKHTKTRNQSEIEHRNF